MTGNDQILQELVEAVNSPDWWAIGITVVNALIMVWLGVKQYRLQQQQTYIQEYQTKLQERQTKHQEYEIYRDLYKTISDVQIEISNFLFSLYVRLSTMPPKEDGVHLFGNEVERIKMLDEQMLSKAIDFKLKLPKEGTIVSNHRNMLTLIYNTYNRLDELYHKGLLVSKTPITPYDDNFIKGLRNDNVLARAILAHIQDGQMAHREYLFLGEFIHNKNKLYELKYLSKIGEQSRVD